MGGQWKAEDRKRNREIRRDFYLRTVQISWSKMTPRQKKRLHRVDPLIAIAVRHLAEDGLIP